MVSKEPQLVLCDPCKRQNESKWHGFVNETTGKVSARFEVCVATKCIAPQVRRHFCRDHILQYELRQVGNLKIRLCHNCGRNLLKLYEDNHQVWFFVYPEGYQPPVQSQEQQQKQGQERPREYQQLVPIITSSKKNESGRRVINVQVQRTISDPRRLRMPIEINEQDNCVCLQTYDELFREKCLGCHPPKCSFDKCNRLAKSGSYCLFHAKLPSSIYYHHEKNIH